VSLYKIVSGSEINSLPSPVGLIPRFSFFENKRSSSPIFVLAALTVFLLQTPGFFFIFPRRRALLTFFPTNLFVTFDPLIFFFRLLLRRLRFLASLYSQDHSCEGSSCKSFQNSRKEMKLFEETGIRRGSKSPGFPSIAQRRVFYSL